MADHIERAKQAFINREFETAVDEYKKAEKLMRADQVYVAYSNRGAALMNLGKAKEAIKLFKRALELNPEHYESMHNMGVAYIFLKSYKNALQCFESTIEEAPYFYASHCAKSQVLSMMGRYQEAVDSAKDAIQEDPNEPLAHSDLGYAYLKSGKFEESVRAYERAIELKDQSSETQRLYAMALSELATLCERANNSESAIEFYLKSVNRHETALAYQNLGILYNRDNQVNKSINAFGKALKVDPNFFASNASLGVLHAQEGRTDIAVPLLVKAQEINPSSSETAYNLGLCYFKLGQDEDAKTQFKIVLDLDPTNEDAKLAKEVIKQKSTAPRSASVHKSKHTNGNAHGRSESVHSSKHKHRSESVHSKRPNGILKKTSKRKLYSLEELRMQPPPKSVDSSQREMHLHDQEFVELFGISKDEWLVLPSWKQIIERKKYDLF